MSNKKVANIFLFSLKLMEIGEALNFSNTSGKYGVNFFAKVAKIFKLFKPISTC
jgi:hypothetical protein